MRQKLRAGAQTAMCADCPRRVGCPTPLLRLPCITISLQLRLHSNGYVLRTQGKNVLFMCHLQALEREELIFRPGTPGSHANRDGPDKTWAVLWQITCTTDE